MDKLSLKKKVSTLPFDIFILRYLKIEDYNIYIIIYIIVFITMCLQLKGSQINYLIACLLLVIINVRMFFMLLSFISTLGFRFIQMWYLI